MIDFIDHLRTSRPKTPQPVFARAWGCDPDTGTTGWGMIEARLQARPIGNPIVPTYASSGIIENQLKGSVGLLRVEGMVEAIARWQIQSETIHREDPDDSIVVVESQQWYGNRVDPNDLIRLGHITGALLIHFAFVNRSSRAVLPAKWKAQKSKDGMAARVKERLAEVVKPGSGWEDVPRSQEEHLVDGLCMAWWGLEQLWEKHFVTNSSETESL